jgi:hypothetical protein
MLVQWKTGTDDRVVAHRPWLSRLVPKAYR